MPRSDRVVTFAPQLRFYNDADGYPVDPDLFRQAALLRRYGWSKACDDACYDPAKGRWVPLPKKVAERLQLAGPHWDTVIDLIDSDTRDLRPERGVLGPVTRPRDARNLWRSIGDEDRSGFALELVDLKLAGLGGMLESPAPVLVDQVQLLRRGVTLDAVVYWFFYSFNPQTLPGYHEGDWEHVSVLFADGGNEPVGVYYASHEKGITLPWKQVPTADDTHPVVYVERQSHASFPWPPSAPHFYSKNPPWPTWQGTLDPLKKSGHAMFDGAWGRVASGLEVTGPLGPYFKRFADSIDVRALGL